MEVTTEEAKQLVLMNPSDAASWVIKTAFDRRVSEHFIWHSAICALNDSFMKAVEDNP